MANMSWGVLQRLCDDEPPIRVWREERGLSLDQLAEQTGIAADRLADLDDPDQQPNDAELSALSSVLRVPWQYLSYPQDDSDDWPKTVETAFAEDV
jgi:transcriptional regulator with XRE-family HTH domain